MPATPTPHCEIYIDGASRGNPGPSGVGVVLRDGPTVVKQLSRYIGDTTNNVAEYLAMVYALQEALQAGYSRVTIKTDSELLARQINGQYKVRDPRLRIFYEVIQHLGRNLAQWHVEHIPRTQNTLADRLAGQAVRGKVRGQVSLITEASAKG